MANISGRPEEADATAIDAAADLHLLKRVTTAVDADYYLDLGPWWYAPGIATMLLGITLYGQPDGGSLSVAAGLVGLTTGSVVGWHDQRRRKLRMGPSRRGLWYVVPIVLTLLVAVSLWGTAISTIGYQRFVPLWAVAGWFSTTVALLGLRSLTDHWRQRWARES